MTTQPRAGRLNTPPPRLSGYAWSALATLGQAMVSRAGLCAPCECEASGKSRMRDHRAATSKTRRRGRLRLRTRPRVGRSRARVLPRVGVPAWCAC